MIKIEHLRKAYPNVTPLQDVNVEIHDGDVISVIGPSGTGKSTLLRCINLLERPTSGTNIMPETCKVLAEHPNIAAIKEASGNISQIADTAMLIGDKMDIYSGNDDQIIPIMALGGIGVISVLSNVFPKETVELCNRFFEGDIKGANALQLHYLPLIHALFSEVNPIPVKAAMAAMGYCENYLRLPLTPMDAAKEAHLLDLMRKEGLKV